MKEPDFLCRWNFCKTCIDYRIQRGLSTKYLRKGRYKKYEPVTNCDQLKK